MYNIDIISIYVKYTLFMNCSQHDIATALAASIANSLMLDEKLIEQKCCAMNCLGMDDVLQWLTILANENRMLKWENRNLKEENMKLKVAKIQNDMELQKNNEEMRIIKYNIEENRGVVFTGESPNVRIFIGKDGAESVECISATTVTAEEACAPEHKARNICELTDLDICRAIENTHMKLKLMKKEFAAIKKFLDDNGRKYGYSRFQEMIEVNCTLIPDAEKPSASSMAKVCFSASVYPAIAIQGGSDGDVKRNAYIMKCFAEECEMMSH